MHYYVGFSHFCERPSTRNCTAIFPIVRNFSTKMSENIHTKLYNRHAFKSKELFYKDVKKPSIRSYTALFPIVRSFSTKMSNTIHTKLYNRHVFKSKELFYKYVKNHQYEAMPSSCFQKQGAFLQRCQVQAFILQFNS